MQKTLNCIFMVIVSTVILGVVAVALYKLYEHDQFELACDAKDGVVIENELGDKFCFRPERPGEKVD